MRGIGVCSRLQVLVVVVEDRGGRLQVVVEEGHANTGLVGTDLLTLENAALRAWVGEGVRRRDRIYAARLEALRVADIGIAALGKFVTQGGRGQELILRQGCRVGWCRAWELGGVDFLHVAARHGERQL